MDSPDKKDNSEGTPTDAFERGPVDDDYLENSVEAAPAPANYSRALPTA
ncbi:hypothetical protein ABIE18_002430 [Arthrobacter sp. 2762]